MSNTKELTVDARGSLCPKTCYWKTKKVSDANPNAVIITIVDNEVSRDNVEKFASPCGYGVGIRQDGKDFYSLWHQCKFGNGSKLWTYELWKRVILMTKDYLGEGSGRVNNLMKPSGYVCLVDVKPLRFISSIAVLRW